MNKTINYLALGLICLSLMHCKKAETNSSEELTLLRGKNSFKTSAAPNKPNVLFIIVDDLRYNSVNRLFQEAGFEPADPTHGNRGGTNDLVPKTYNIDKLIDDPHTVTFSNAHSAAVECSPSRTALLFGKYPHESGIYRNGNNWSTVVTDGHALSRQFVQDPKYKVFGAGKVYHNGPAHEGKWFNPVNATAPYNNFHVTTDEIGSSGYSSGSPVFSNNGYKFQLININSGKDDFSLDITENVTEDAKAVTFSINKMQGVVNQNVGKPASEQSSFFVAVGIRRPHSPLIVPQHYFDSTNAPSATPKILPADTNSLPPRAQYLINNNPNIPPDVMRVSQPTDWANYVKAYAAAVTYSDAQIGRLINFIDENPTLKKNTIIVLISDHGFHLGEKHHVKKTTLYEETTRVPMIWRVPWLNRGTNKYCRVPVDLMSIYPTLMEYCNIIYPSGISGRDIRNLIANPGTAPDPAPSAGDVALTEMDQKSSSLRSLNYRFIQYNDGGPNGLAEELYNHSGTAYSFDPWEARDLRNKTPQPTLLNPMRNRKNVMIPSWAPMVGTVADE